ncbi:hypothetical protein IQ782_29335 [Salipiger pacificus]|uniref:ATP-binding protein n=1 Tax=Salipiger mangrovisoli TaxID=2865933 RepID=A0ABR9XBF0_9RHOB|nr:hypothetical protein [Salipiger mangrovisoli]
MILAGAGIGKTHEMWKRADLKRQVGEAAFFIRIEDIIEDFELAFEVGNAEDFDAWLASSDEAWFYLDSIDEARIDDPRAFERAIRRFARRIKSAQHRAHVVISSRPYAWRSHTDYVMVKKHLPYAKPTSEVAQTGDADEPANEVRHRVEETSTADDGLSVFVLNDLAETEIRVFAEARGVDDADRLVEDIQRRNLTAVAARPFDLEIIIEKWKEDGKLGSRFDFLNFGISKRLSESDPHRDKKQPLNRERARAGARSLAAAVVLSGKSGIRIPDEHPRQDGVDAAAVLGDWHPNDVHALLERGIFDDVIYGKVRFRHREVRELLAAEWLAEHLKTGSSRRAVETVIFREKYGHKFIAPRLRPLLPWLILLDDRVRQRAVSLSPEIVVEGGDVSRLPVDERKRLLHEIVARIAADTGSRSASDNDAIARIAEPDLSNDVLELIKQNRENDSALFYLGRLVWQGEMTDCVGPLAEIAVDLRRGPYARIAALRAVATAGSKEDFDTTWDRIVAESEPIDRRLAAEIVNNATSNHASVERLLATIERLTPYERFQPTGLSDALHRFVDGFDIENTGGQRELARLIKGLDCILGRAPHLEGGRERISRNQSWLLSAAAHAVERLVGVRSMHALEDDSVAILHKVSAVRFWHDVDLSEHATRLETAVPDWPELNDSIFWSAIDAERAHREATGGAPVTDPFKALIDGCCHYEGEDFERVLAWISERGNEDDKLIAVILAYRLVRETEQPDESLAKLRDSVAAAPALAEHLEGMISWKPSKKQQAMDDQFEKARRKRHRKDAAAKEARRRWIESLKAAPTLARRPETVEPGEMTNNQYHLMQATQKGDSSRWRGDDWRSLISTFGEEVAAEYSNAAKSHWRHYSPKLASEGIDTAGVPNTLIFGLAGLEIEAEQTAEFPRHLSDDELRLAIRYVPWELNGFPTWSEKAFRDRPEIVSHLMLQELAWDLGRDEAPRSYMLHDIVYHAPWLHSHIAGWVIDWLNSNTVRNTDVLRQAIYIAKSIDDSDRLSNLARSKVELELPVSEQAKWYALWVDTEAVSAIPQLEDWLGSMPADEASTAAQHFITELLGDRRGQHLGTGFDSYRKPEHLKRLYTLMHQHIRASEDIERAGRGAYSPGLRDDAQDARNGLFNVLCDIPGKATFLALGQLAEDHPNKPSRDWMLQLASKRAEIDGDVDDWTDAQIREFDVDQSLAPATNAQLFTLAVHRLIDIRTWLEDSNDSPYRTWRRAEAETEVRNLITGRLNDLANGKYTCAQENEMPNSQRPDIWLQAPDVTPVPIELKLLDKGWTGPELCERLRNQLAGDYLRAKAGGRGIMLLTWQGRVADRKWEIDGCRVDLNDLETALQDYWHSIARDWPDIDEVKVIVIDLTRRGPRSNT